MNLSIRSQLLLKINSMSMNQLQEFIKYCPELTEEINLLICLSNQHISLDP